MINSKQISIPGSWKSITVFSIDMTTQQQRPTIVKLTINTIQLNLVLTILMNIHQKLILQIRMAELKQSLYRKGT